MEQSFLLPHEQEVQRRYIPGMSVLLARAKAHYFVHAVSSPVNLSHVIMVFCQVWALSRKGLVQGTLERSGVSGWGGESLSEHFVDATRQQQYEGDIRNFAPRPL